MLKSLVIIGLSLVLNPVFAQQSEQPILYQSEFKCPETHPLVKNLLDEVTSFQKKLAQDLNCKEVAADFDKLTGLLKGRKDFINLILSKENTELSVENAKKIQTYSKEVTEEVGTLVHLIGSVASGGLSWESIFGGGDACKLDKAQELEGLERLTSAAYEATALLSKVAGPYGVPLQIGAEVMRGVVSGLVAYSERTKNIDFSEGADGGLAKRQFYENSVCMMVKLDADLNRIINPRRHLQKLYYVRNKAAESQETVLRVCEECQEVAGAETQEEAERLLSTWESDETKPAIFMKIGRATLQSKVDMDWLDEEIAKFEGLNSFGGSGIGPSEAHDLRLSVRKFLYQTATKDFLNYYIGEAKEHQSNFERYVRGYLRFFDRDLAGLGANLDYGTLPEELYSKMRTQVQQDYNVEDENLVRLLAEDSAMYFHDLYYLHLMNEKAHLISNYSPEIMTKLANSVDYWKSTTTSLEVAGEYCQFFRESAHYETLIKNLCESTKYEDLALQTSYQAFYLASIIGDQRDILERRRGPIDFRLADRLTLIEQYKESRENYVLLSDISLDVMALIEAENEAVRDERELEEALQANKATRGTLSFDDWYKSIDVRADELDLLLQGVESSRGPQLQEGPL